MMALTIIHTELKLNFAYFPIVVSKMHFFVKRFSVFLFPG